MRASDYIQARNEMLITWAQALYDILDSDRLAETEKGWVLGNSAAGAQLERTRRPRLNLNVERG